MSQQSSAAGALIQAVAEASKITLVQAENPDGDSLGSSLALEEILANLGKNVIMYCPVDIPKYLRYANGWDRVVTDFPTKTDITIILDTASKTLLEKALTPENLAVMMKSSIFAIDHHVTKSDLPFDHQLIDGEHAIATAEVIYDICKRAKWSISELAAENLLIALLSDSLGFTSEATTPKSLLVASELMELGTSPSVIELRRRSYMKKSPEILSYKGELLKRIEYYLDGQLALIHIPWEEIANYSDQYNPSMLVIDEMRLVVGVRLAIALKTYPDGKITAKIRANPDTKIAETVASFFGGGGHPYAAGFRAYDSYDTILKELLLATEKAIKEYDATATQ